MPLSPPRTIRRTCVVAATAMLFAVLALLGPSGAAASPAPYCSSDVSVTLHSANPIRDLVVALPQPYDEEGKRPIMWSHLGNQNQRWCMVAGPSGPTDLEYHNARSGKCLTAAGTAANNTPVKQQTCNGSPFQRWIFRDVNVGEKFALQNIGTGGCLDVVGKNAAEGALLQTWGCNYSAWNQIWSFGRYGN